MSDTYQQTPAAALIQFYSWLRDTGELDRLIEDIVAKVREDREEQNRTACVPPTSPSEPQP